jgi:hypothetical protein
MSGSRGPVGHRASGLSRSRLHRGIGLSPSTRASGGLFIVEGLWVDTRVSSLRHVRFHRHLEGVDGDGEKENKRQGGSEGEAHDRELRQRGR